MFLGQMFLPGAPSGSGQGVYEPQLTIGQRDDSPPAFLMVGDGRFVGGGQQVLAQETVHVFLVKALAIGGIDKFGGPHLALRAKKASHRGRR